MGKKIFHTIAFLLGTCFAFVQGQADKFIPTYYIKYGGTPSVNHKAEYSSRFDLIIASSTFYGLWAEKGLNSWEALRAYNPKIILALYQMGAHTYITGSSGEFGDGWDWIKANHGVDAGNERWTGSGHKYSYLTQAAYPAERLMYLGNPDWQKYWIEKTYEDRYIKMPSKFEGADAVFSDGPGFYVTAPLYDENNPGKAEFIDHLKDYSTVAGIDDDSKWRKDTKSFISSTVSIFASKSKPLKLVSNFGYMGKHPENWYELDTMKNSPFAAMEEGAFVNPWGKTFNIFDWEIKINVMKGLKNVVALMNNTGKIPTGEGMAKMDVVMSEGNMGPATGWDALWFSMTSFLMALNENKSNGIFGFTVWGYAENYYLDEYDPKYLHLGKPLGDYYIPASGPSKDIAFREYEDGWVVTSKPHTEAKTNVPVPKGKAYVVTHGNLKDPFSGKLVTTFDIGKNRGLILLKEGRKIGNEDNIWPLNVKDSKKKISETNIIPNPFKKSFTLNNNTEINEVVITDLSGKNVYVNKPNYKKHGIDGSSLLPGLYIIKCRLGNSWSVNKVLKQ